MKRPLFAVGEVVMLQSRDHPEHNGEYSVSMCLSPGERYFDPIAQRFAVNKKGGYMLDGADVGSLASCGTPCATVWNEKALRKRHQPGEYSFDALKQILAMPVSRGDFA